MKIILPYRLVRYVAAYHFLSFLVIFFVLNPSGVSARSDLKTKLLLKNIRTHLAQKADEILKKKECESGLILCKGLKTKKSEEIPPPPKLFRGQHKPVAKVSPKEIIQSFTPKAHKNSFKKSQRLTENERSQKMFHRSPETQVESYEKNKSDRTADKVKKIKISDFQKLPNLHFHKKKPFKASEELNFVIEVSKERLKNESDILITKKRREKIIEKLDTGKKTEREVGKKKESPKRLRQEERDEIKKVKTVMDSTEKTEFDSIFHPPAFIFEVDSDDEKRANNLCKKHSQIFLKHLKKYKMWALMMYDASAKFSSGILQGNVNNFGDFDECLSINAVFKNVKEKSKKSSGIKGKYCLANLDVTTHSETNNLRLVLERAESFQFIKSTVHDPSHFIPRFSTINWGLCVPSACLAEDVEKFLKSRLEIYSNFTGLHFDVDVDERNCVVKDNLKLKLETGTLMAILFYLIVLNISLYATYLDSRAKKKEDLSEKHATERKLEDFARDVGVQNENEIQEVFGKNKLKYSFQEKIKSIIMAFSIKRNVKKLLGESNKGAIECINGIKSIFTIMLYFAHKTIPLGMTPFSNRIFLTKISNQPITVLLRASIIYTDSFLLISGVLTSYNLSKEISEQKKICWVNKLIARFIRLTPALFAVVLFYAYIWDRLGSGPIWNLIVSKNSWLCQKHMWRNLLYIQNLFAFEHMCAPQTHQLALDMQLSLLAPFFVHLIQTYDKAGIGILQALFILSSIMRYITTLNNELSVVIYHGMPVPQLYKTANLLYGQTIHRASPYILGTIVGYHLRKYEKKIDIPKALAALGWILCFSFGFYSVVSSSPLALRAYKYDVQEAAHYAALAPVGWSLALSWLITACHLGYGGVLNEFLSRKIFLVFSRISYSIYLTQFLVFFYKVGVKRIPEMFTFAGSINVTEFFLVVVVSVMVTLFFDIPMMEIKKIILDQKTTKVLEGDVKIEETGQSQEGLQMQIKKQISHEDLQTNTDELEVSEGEDEDNYEKEVANNNADEETEENSEGNTNENIVTDTDEEVEVFEIRPLKRSTRIHFGDDSEGKKFVTVEPQKEDEVNDE